MDSTYIYIYLPDWKDPIHSFSCVFWVSTLFNIDKSMNYILYVYIYKYKNNIHIHIIFSSHLHPSAPAKTRSAAQRLKKRRVLRSQRGLPFSLSPMRTTSKSQSPVRERVSKEGNQIGKQPLFMGSCKKWVTSCFLHTGLLPRYPILHS